jgi:uncharacterized protein YebE (UPF0316 family)
MLVLQLVLVPVMTLRTIMLVKGYTKYAVPLGFLETFIYIIGVSIVLGGDQNVIKMLVYSIGYAAGLFLGSKLEKKLAIGFTTLQVNILNKNQSLIDELREDGYGVTVFEGQGRDSVRYKLEIVCKRNKQKSLIAKILKVEEDAFIAVYETIEFKGGHLLKNLKNIAK